MAQESAFLKPEHWENPNGEARKVGFEFELSGLNVADLSNLVKDLFGGKVQSQSLVKAVITDSTIGEVTIELDAMPVKKLISRLESENDKDAENSHLSTDLQAKDEAFGLSTRIKDCVVRAGELVVPYEIVTAPLAFEQFSELERLRLALYKKNSAGTKASPVNAFGLHINPEVASYSASYIRDTLRAFLVLYPWLRDVMKIDVTRRILTFIDPFPDTYVKMVLAQDYEPDLDGLIADYLTYNPTRNRALDLLPLFAFLKPQSLDSLSKVDRKLVKARPTFHYRLPNCEIDNRDWRIAREWNYWVEVERLAGDPPKLGSMAQGYLKFLSDPLSVFDRDWIHKTAQMVRHGA